MDEKNVLSFVRLDETDETSFGLVDTNRAEFRGGVGKPARTNGIRQLVGEGLSVRYTEITWLLRAVIIIITVINA